MKTSDNKMLCMLGFKVQGDMGDITCYTNKQDQVVWYLKAPPDKPPSWLQTRQRNLFRYAASGWRSLDWYNKWCWGWAAQAAHLRISGYNLWMYRYTTGDDKAIQTIERQVGIELARMIG